MNLNKYFIIARVINVINRALYFEYSINSPCDEEVLFPSICAVHLFNQLQLRKHIAIKFVTGIASPDKGTQTVHTFSGRQNVELIHNKQYGGMIFKFVDAVETNTALLPLLQLDTIGTQYIVSPRPFSAKFSTANWNISEKALIQLDLAKFVCSIDQDRTLKLFFNEKYYNARNVETELIRWEHSICKITRMSQMKRKAINSFGMPRFVDIMVY